MDKELMPVVYKIVSDAELSLSKLIGVDVKLRMELNNTGASLQEAQMVYLQNLICDEYNVSWAEMLAPGRKTQFVDARGAYCYLVRKYFNYSLSKIGDILGKDHTTVIHYINRVSGYIHVGDNAAIRIKRIERRFYENYTQS